MSTIDERNYLRREEVDFRSVWSKIKRGWPVIALSLLFFAVLGIIFQIAYPPRYAVKTTVVIEKPRGINDPLVVVNQESAMIKTDDFYYNNQKVAFKSYPLVSAALEKVGLIRYFKAGLINREIYNLSPFRVELDSTYMTFKDYETPYGGEFYVRMNNFDSYHVEVEGEYPISGNEYYFEGDFQFGEWVTFDRTRFKLIPVDTLANEMVTLANSIFEDEFGFVLMNRHQAVLDYISNIEITPLEMESSTYAVSIVQSAPEKQVHFLNTLGQVFLDDHMEQKTNALRMAITYLNDELAQVTSHLESSEEQIETFKSERSITSLNQEGELLLEQTMRLESDKVNYVVKGKYYEYLEEVLKNEEDYTGLISPEAFGVKDMLLIQLTEELISLQRDLNSLERQNAQSNPTYADIQARIEANRTTMLNSIRGFKESNRVMIQNIDKRIGEMDRTAKNIPKAERELMELQRYFKINEQLYLSLMNKKSEAEIALISVAPDVRIIEPAYISSAEPVLPYLPLTMAVVIVLGLITGFGLLILYWVFNDKIDTHRDVFRFAPGAEVVGEVYHTGIRTPEDLDAYPQSRVANQLSSIRYQLGFSHPNSKIWTVGSKSADEGKTFLSTLLASHLARSGRRTLLIDGNADSPELKKKFSIRLGPSLLDVVRGQASAAEAVTATGRSGLDVAELGGGRNKSDRELESLADLIRDLAASYDHVLIDTAPIEGNTESLMLLALADVRLITVRRRKTSYADLEELDDMLGKEPLKGALVVILDTFDHRFGLAANRRRKKAEKNPGLLERLRLVFRKV